MRQLVFPAVVVLAVLPSTVRGQASAGAEFQVNTYTTGYQGFSAAASDGSGNFVVVWRSDGQDGSNPGVFGRRFNASGVPQGSEFRVNTYTTGNQAGPGVARDVNGNFVVVWNGNYQDGSGFGIFGQRINASGTAQGSEFRLNTYTTGNQSGPAVVSDANANFVVVWQSYLQDGSSYGIFGRRFNAGGVAQGSEFRVNTYTTGFQDFPALALGVSGNFVVVWESLGEDGSVFGVFGQRLDASGTPQGGQFRVNSYTTGNQGGPAVASDANGNFVVVWQSAGQDGDGYGVFGQRFDASGAAQASEFRINSYTTNDQVLAGVSSDAHGNFVVVWGSYGEDGSNLGIFGRRFNASGTPQGSEFRVNTYTTSGQRSPALASSPDGDFVVVWQGNNQDGSGYGVFGQRYGDLIFEDGFESGDLTRWSSAATDGGNLSVSGVAAMAGTAAGLQAIVNDTNAHYVEDDTPGSESRYRARFYFDPNGFDPGEASSHFRVRIFLAQDSSNLRVITIVLKRQGGQYSIEGRARLNDGTRVDTAFFDITNAPHFIEFDWQRATGPGTLDGYLALLIDNVTVSVLTSLDNDQTPVDFVRMGALSIKTGAAGTLFFDQFESRRQNLIGPE